MTRETLPKVEQSLLVLLNSHGCSSSGRVTRNAFLIILFDGIGRDNRSSCRGTVTRQAHGHAAAPRSLGSKQNRVLAPTELRGDVFQDARPRCDADHRA